MRCPPTLGGGSVYLRPVPSGSPVDSLVWASKLHEVCRTNPGRIRRVDLPGEERRFVNRNMYPCVFSDGNSWESRESVSECWEIKRRCILQKRSQKCRISPPVVAAPCEEASKKHSSYACIPDPFHLLKRASWILLISGQPYKSISGSCSEFEI